MKLFRIILTSLASVVVISGSGLIVSCTDTSTANSQTPRNNATQRKVSVGYDFGPSHSDTKSKRNQKCDLGGMATAKPVRVDWKNAQTKTDYFALAISWSPQHCAKPGNYSRHRLQCTDNQFKMVVHGLWPQSSVAKDKFGHPRHCKSGGLLDNAILKKHICTVPGAQLMQSQWIKHGSCAFNTAADYFNKIETLWSRLKKPDLKPATHELITVNQLKELFVSANNGSLTKDHIRVWLNRKGFLREIVICYDLNYRYTNCALNGAPAKQQVKIRFN